MDFIDAVESYNDICRHFTDSVYGECGDNCPFNFLDRYECLRNLVYDPDNAEKIIAEWRAGHESSCEERGEAQA